MTPRTTVFCAVWSGDPNRRELLHGHRDSLARQTVPVEIVYVFDNGDAAPEGIGAKAVTSRQPLTIYQAWNVAVRFATTDYVMNLNLDDRLAPDAVETMQAFADANGAGLVAGDWHVRYTQPDTDNVRETFRSSALPFDPAWPPVSGCSTRLGSGSGDRGTFGPATLWRRALHDQAPYPWQFADGKPIRIVGDLAWWRIVGLHLHALMLRLPVVVGNYHSHPGEQAEFRSADEHELLSTVGINMTWFPHDGITVASEETW